jgi:Mg-chelatase subunit ChlD
LRVSKNSKDFSIAVVTFDTSAKIHSTITRVDDGEGNLIDEYADYNPMKGHGGGTDIGAGLRVAESLAEEFLNSAPMESVPHSVAIVVMSDGMSGGNPIPIANRLKDNRRITICTALLAKKGENSQDDKKARELLQEIASSPIAYTTVYDAESLRRFFVASVSVGCDVHMR